MTTTTVSTDDINCHDLTQQEQAHLVQQQQQEQQLKATTTAMMMTTTILKPIHPSTIEDDERHARKNNSETYVHRKSCQYKSIYWLCVNTYASMCIFVLHLISYETIFSALLSVGLTLYLYFSIIQDDDDNVSFNGNTMNWVLLTFAVITPIGATIQMVFTRRENALLQISTLRSTLIQLYNSYAIWGWDYRPYGTSNSHMNGRTKSNLDWLEHSDLALREICFLCDDLTRYVCGAATRAWCRANRCTELNEIVSLFLLARTFVVCVA